MLETPDTNAKQENTILYFSKHIGAQFLFFTFVVCLIYVAKNPGIVTMTFTNIGFAVFLALANTCFSWARSLPDEKDKESAKTINNTAMCSIFCALTFVTSSILQLVINSVEPKAHDFIFTEYFFWILKLIRILLISIVLMFGFGIAIELFKIIIKRIINYLMEDSDKKDK